MYMNSGLCARCSYPSAITALSMMTQPLILTLDPILHPAPITDILTFTCSSNYTANQTRAPSSSHVHPISFNVYAPVHRLTLSPISAPSPTMTDSFRRSPSSGPHADSSDGTDTMICHHSPLISGTGFPFPTSS